MDVASVLHMKEGNGDTSYSKNSSLQKKSIDAVKHKIIDSAVRTLLEMNKSSSTPAEATFTVADLGCSTGSNSLELIKEIVDAVAYKQERIEFMVYLNDLPSSDFNALFRRLPELQFRISNALPPLVCVAGAPGSFYERLFPKGSLNFVFSCNSLHWLSQVPSGLYNGDTGESINKKNIYISESSPPIAAEIYSEQFQNDFDSFLKSRSVELAEGGRIVFTMLGRKTEEKHSKSATYLWDALAQSFANLASQGIVEECKVDSYNAPFYAPSLKEIEEQVQKKGDFVIEYAETYEFQAACNGDPRKDAETMSMTVRAIQEPMISYHFGDGCIEELFRDYTQVLTETMSKEEIRVTLVCVVLRKSEMNNI